MAKQKSKGMVRANNRSSAGDGKRTARPGVGGAAEPIACEKCGSLYARGVWRTGRRLNLELLEKAGWETCPACESVARDEYVGRVRIAGKFAREHEGEIRRRIANIERRARFTQPQRRIVSAEAAAESLEILTTSQKLAHRMASELKKAFGGRVTYAWSDDGSLYATWRSS